MNNGTAVLPSQNAKPAFGIRRQADHPAFAFTPQGNSLPTLNKRLLWTPHRKIVRLPGVTFCISKGKRWLDVSVSSLIFVFVLSWLLPLLGFLILLESPGLILFVQPRSGRKGKCFDLYYKLSFQAGDNVFRHDAEIMNSSVLIIKLFIINYNFQLLFHLNSQHCCFYRNVNIIFQHTNYLNISYMR